LLGVGAHIQHEGADMAVQPVQLQPLAGADALHGIHRRAGFDVEAEAVPRFGVAGVEIQPQPDRHLPAQASGDLFHRVELVKMVEMDRCALEHGLFERRPFPQPGRDDAEPGTPSARALYIRVQKPLQPRRLLVQDVAYGAEIVGLVRPAWRTFGQRVEKALPQVTGVFLSET
jgi:hypothetical protein